MAGGRHYAGRANAEAEKHLWPGQAPKNLTTTDLDYLIDLQANTIGALMLHLAATETYYQLNTFEGKKWDTWPDSVKQKSENSLIVD